MTIFMCVCHRCCYCFDYVCMCVRNLISKCHRTLEGHKHALTPFGSQEENSFLSIEDLIGLKQWCIKKYYRYGWWIYNVCNRYMERTFVSLSSIVDISACSLFICMHSKWNTIFHMALCQVSNFLGMTFFTLETLFSRSFSVRFNGSRMDFCMAWN